MAIKSIGFPRIKNYAGDVRDFLPSLFGYLKKFEDLEIFVEETYGSGLGLKEEDYLKENDKIQFVPAETVYQKDLIVILKMPELSELEKLRDGCSLFTMCHYPTRPAYVELFKRKNIFSLSMDGIEDDYGKRLLLIISGQPLTGRKLPLKNLRNPTKIFTQWTGLPFT